MYFPSGIAAFACLLSLVRSEQFVIPFVEEQASKAVNHFPHHDYVGAKTQAPKPVATPKENVKSSSSTPYWYEEITHQGISAFGPSGYVVYRNVMDYGATGNGVTDDTAAIQAAIADGGRCGEGCASSTTTPAVVYFPAGTYLISASLFDYYYTMMIGNPNDMPTIKASANFGGGSGGWMIDGDPYFSPNLNWGSTNVFNRQIRNFIIDMTAVPATTPMAGIHWPTAQATSLQNIVFQMSSASGTQHEGVFCESGSAGFMTDLIFNGGNIGLAIGNQQYTIRNCVFNNVRTAISHYWDWGFLYHGMQINNCSVGIDITAGGTTAETVGSIVLVDSVIQDTGIAIKTSFTSSSSPPTAGSLALENVVLDNVPIAVQDNGATVLGGGTLTIAAWGQGHEYTPNGPTFFESSFTPNSRPASLVSGSHYYTMSKPQYNTTAVSDFVSARSSGATGNGATDDTAALQNAINSAASSGKILFVDAGTYKVTSTLTVPPGSIIVGEAYPVIMASGSFFSNINSPEPVVQVGTAGQTGQVQWSDMIVATQGATAGATLIKWNLATTSSPPSGMWDVHTRVGGFDGSNLQAGNCPTNPTDATPNPNCIAAYMHMHVTPSAEGLYMENNWLWTADHDIDNSANTQTTIFSGRGLYIESTAGTFWLWGTAVEHSSLYQYQFANTKNIFMGFIQTETPYYQPTPNAEAPFSPVSSLNDPNFASTCSGQPTNCPMAWGFRALNSNNLLVYGAGHYSFFNDQSTTCSDEAGPENCQQNIVSIEGTSSNVNFYCLNTVGTENMVLHNGVSLATYSENVNVFPDTIALFVGV